MDRRCHHQRVIYGCDLDDTRQQMACRATISKIYQRDGAWEYDILGTARRADATMAGDEVLDERKGYL